MDKPRLPPLFLYGFAGALGSLSPHRPFWIIVPLFFILLLIGQGRRGLMVTLFLSMTLYSSFKVTLPEERTLFGTAWLHIVEEKRVDHKKESYLVRGYLDFSSEKGHYYNLPFTMKLGAPLHHDRILSEGRLTKQQERFFFFPKKGSACFTSDDQFSLAYLRFVAKEKVREWIYTTYSLPHVKELISALVIGELSDVWIKGHFSRFGLQHLLAISGFHFSLMAFMTSFFLSWIFSGRMLSWSMAFFVTGYFIFLGPSPSIIRAWTASLLYFLGEALYLRSHALNHFGLGLFLIAIYDPLLVDSPGTILSFSATFALLSFATPIEEELQMLLPKRSGREVLELRGTSFGYGAPLFHLVQKFLRKSVALNLAVSSAVIPLSLFYFGQFPFLSLFYNLFFPGLVAITLFLAILSPIPYIATINDYFTHGALALTQAIPEGLEGALHGYLSGWVIILWLTALFIRSLFIKKDLSIYKQTLF